VRVRVRVRVRVNVRVRVRIRMALLRREAAPGTGDAGNRAGRG
jgi:hypothetical protein